MSSPGGDVVLLAVDGELGGAGFVGRLDEQRAGAAGGVVDGGLAQLAGALDADHLRHDPRHLGRGVELALALAAFGGEVAHQVLVGVAQQVVALGPVGAKVEAVEDRHQLRQPVLHLLARAELALVVEVGLVDDPLRSLAAASFAMILLILSPISLSPLSATMSAKLAPFGTSISEPWRRRPCPTRTS